MAPPNDPTAALMRGLADSPARHRAGLGARRRLAADARGASCGCANGDELTRRPARTGTALFSRTGLEDRSCRCRAAPLGDELAEELRRLDADQPYAEALGAAAGRRPRQRPPTRVHVWQDPAAARRAEAGVTARGSDAA